MNTPETLQPMLIDSLTTAALLGISERTLWSLTQEGKLPRVKINSRVLFDPTDLRAFIAKAKEASK